MREIVQRLLRIAAPKKKETKYTKNAENAFDELLVYFAEESEYSKKDRAFRLLLRIQKAMSAEGYKFQTKVMPASPSSSTTLPKTVSPGKSVHLLYSGGMCTLLKSRPPEGLDISVVMKLMEYIGSKQCFQYKISPKSSESVRKTGVNVSLPKPLTWSRLENYGLTREPIVTNDGRILMEEFTIEGITAFTCDRSTFYISNQGTCRRWMEGLDRIIDSALNR